MKIYFRNTESEPYSKAFNRDSSSKRIYQTKVVMETLTFTEKELAVQEKSV